MSSEEVQVSVNFFPLYIAVPIASVIVICVLTYYWFTMKFNHFKNNGIPGPKPSFPFGNMPNMITQSRNMTYDYDDIYQ